jgi:hypothetical protein
MGKILGGDRNMKSGMFYAMMFFITLSPIYFMYIGIIPLKSLLARNVITKALEPMGKYLVCVLGMKTMFRRIQTLLSIMKYFIYLCLMIEKFQLIILIMWWIIYKLILNLKVKH